MVKTRSQAEPAADAEQQGTPGASTVHHAEPPRSPSDRPAGPSRVELPTNPLPPLQEHAAATTTVQQRPEPRRVRSPAASRRSSTGSAARLRLQLEIEAQERLADISRRELRLEADIVKKRLALELENVNIDDQSTDGSRVHERVNEWLDQTNKQQDTDPTSCPAATTSAGQEGIATNIPRPLLELRGEHLATPHIKSSHEPPRHTQAPQNEARRSRSPTPTRTSRGIEQLAQVLEKLSRSRPPPRQAYELPAFSGAPNEWLPFQAAMRDTTKLYHLSPVENLARLRTHLKGEARDTVAALLHTASSPDDIMNTLEQCYGRPEMIVDRALEDLRRLPKLGTNANDINSFAIKVQNTVTVLKNIDRKGYLHNPLLVREIIEKLSPHLRSRWCDFACEHQATDQQEVVTLSRFLMREANLAVRFAYLTAASSSTPTATTATRQAQKNTGPAGPARYKTRGVPVYTATEEERKRECPCCGNDHRISTCRKLRDMDVSARWEWAKTAHMCFRCIEDKHRRNRCRAPACGTNGCRRPHHPLLHSNESAAASEEPNQGTEAVMSIATTNEERTVLLKVCSIMIAGPAGEVPTFALLDEGSTVTLIDQELADSIGAVGTPAPLNLRGVNATETQEDSQRVTITIRGRQEPTAHKMTARTITRLELRQQSVPRDISRYAHLRHIKNACFKNAKPRVLIGTDNWHLIVSRQLSLGKKNEPAASRTDLGWVIYGTIPRLLRQNEDDTALHIHTAERREKADYTVEPSSDDRLHELVKKHFAVNALGISLNVKVKPEDQRAVEMFNQTARRVDHHYEVGLPWRADDVVLPPNYSDAFTRLRGIEKKMDRDPQFEVEYTQQIRNLIEKGYAVKCDGSERDSAIQWFLPHFAVKNPNKPGKVRLVFDAAHRSQGTSLNENLLEGPDLLLSLPGILFRFRERAIAVTADIAEMFLRVKIRSQDQPAQLFLWRGNDRSKPPDQYKMTSMIFGASSSPFLAHSVRNKNALDHAHTYPRALPIITQSHYMDDLVHSFDTTEEAQLTINEVIKVHAQADFTLRSWNTNCPRLLSNIPEELRARKPTTLGSSEIQNEKTLGMLWDAANDELGFNTTLARVPEPVRAQERVPTKRQALAAVMSIFDPLGLLSSYTITARILLQDLWRIQMGWDDELPPEYAERFDQWLEALSDVAQLRIPRRYNEYNNSEPRRQLHIFVDASEKAYAAAAYWRLQHADGHVVVTLAAAKAKVAPLRPQTIPRLELQAAVIGARLADLIKREHRWRADKVVYWSDSRTVIQWIETDARRYTPYVAHRLGEIAELTEIHQWRWVPTEHNVADDATRGETVPKDRYDRWFSGPAFLCEPEDTWPRVPSACSGEDSEAVHHVTNTGGASALPDMARFSSYERLIRATATVLAFVDKCRKRTTCLELRHIERAEKLWMAQAQEESFGPEIQRLNTGQTLPPSSRLTKLDPVMEDGLLRVRGRIDAAQAPNETKRPFILDGRHPLTRLIVLKEHAAAGHASNERVLNDLRQRVWILRARPTVRTVARACALCKVRRAMPRVPPLGDMPRARLDPHHRPFTNSGVDYFGPMMVAVGRRREKRWGALFTCLTTRAVHIELVGSLNIDSAIMALRRMAARRGWPHQIWSDNGTNFRGADAELRAAYQEWTPALREYSQLQRVDWRFIAPGAPNQGGSWERLVRSIKTALSATLNEQLPKEEVLHTLLLEAEHAVNSRPLTHVSVDPADPEALTPNHFLIGASTGLPRCGPCDPADRKKWRAVQGLADQFWRRWVQEYLPTLVPRGSARDGRRPLHVGDLVLVVDPSLPRNTWPRGVVERVHAGPDGDVRSAEIRTTRGVFTRPTRKLAVLPVQEAATSLRRGEDVTDG